MKHSQAKHTEKAASQRIARRDRRFREELARAWDVERVPDSFSKRLEETFDRLPPEPIVKVRPLRRFVRGAAGFAAACAALFAVLAAVNFVQPRFTESLPGLGEGFRRFNDFLREQTATPPPAEPLPSLSPPPFSAIEEEDPAETPALSSLPVSDGEIELMNITCDEDRRILAVHAQLPFMGRRCYGTFTLADNIPLGCWPILSLSDGTLFYPSYEEEFFDYYQTDLGNTPVAVPDTDPCPASFIFYDVPVEPGKTAVLTFYESGDWTDDLFCGDERYEPIEPEKGSYLGKRVTAEFTLDLVTGKAAPSRRYEAEGLRRITPEECRQAAWGPEFEQPDSCLAGNVSLTSFTPDDGEPACWYKVEVFSRTDRVLILNGYLNGRQTAAATNFAPDSEGGREYLFDELTGGLPWYIGSFGGNDCVWFEHPLNELQIGKSCTRTVFGIPADAFDAWGDWEKPLELLKSGELVFQLADAETGEVLIDDVYRSFLERRQETLRRWETMCRPKAAASPLPDQSEYVPDTEN